MECLCLTRFEERKSYALSPREPGAIIDEAFA
jgi:hypothetical protein